MKTFILLTITLLALSMVAHALPNNTQGDDGLKKGKNVPQTTCMVPIEIHGTGGAVLHTDGNVHLCPIPDESKVCAVIDPKTPPTPPPPSPNPPAIPNGFAGVAVIDSESGLTIDQYDAWYWFPVEENGVMVYPVE